jgi:hypothetical protein
MSNIFKIEFYVPVEAVENVKNAVFTAGAGKIGNYDCCCWETVGTGHFRPCEGSNPYIGKQEKIEKVEELKIELVCAEEYIDQVIVALKESHPYETPAYQYWAVKA